MKTISSNVNLSDYYYGFLKTLSKESKIALIERLAQSLREDEPQEPENEINSVEAFFEAFKDDLTAQEILTEIRALKNAGFNRPSSHDAGTF